jgi:hypothetical protein
MAGSPRPHPMSRSSAGRDWRADLAIWGGTPASDESFILLEASPRTVGERPSRPSDLWVSLPGPGGWNAPVPLAGRVNTQTGWENFATVTPDGCDLVFVRDFSGFYRVSLRAALPRQTP